MAGVFTIAPELPFLDTLVAGLEAQAGGDPLALARMTVLLPTRRAVRALGEAFLRTRGGAARLLPRLVPVGDLDADELALLGDEDAAEGGLEIAPGIPDLRRRLLLMRLVLRWGQEQGIGPLTPGQAAPLAAELARFLDETQAERCDLGGLALLAPEEHAEHWQHVLKFLAIVTEHWPAILAAEGCLDPADRRNRVLAAQIETWRRKPPTAPVIAAGITGGVPAVGDLVAAVAALEHGTVVLPGLARGTDPETWAEIGADPAHPQHLLARLLERLGLEPIAVADWAAPPASGNARAALVAEAMRPASSSERWRALAPLAPGVLDHVRRFDCASPQDEAVVIALLLRQTLETAGATAALVTPDRDLARRVAAELLRWDIAIDDSAGVPLNRTPPGVFLRLVLAALAEALAPVPLLALLKHPLAACGMAPESFRALARRLEHAVLRGPRPAPGLPGLAAAVVGLDAALGGIVAALGRALAPLTAVLAARQTSLVELAAAHVAAAEALAESDAELGAARLWREPAGEAAAQTMNELLDAAGDAPPLDGGDYPALFEALLSGRVVRPPYGRHPRLFIWGLLEARLQRADRVVLGGLNEGVWPPASDSDPWLSRPMRATFGLPPPERRVGAAAHDFAQALGAPDIVLTRAARVEGTPTVPSRWLLRLDTVLRAGGREGALRHDAEPLAWQARLDDAERIPPHPPEPRPPVAARPRALSVTQIETWRRDPYAIYARHVLRLRALEPLDADPGAAERGNFIHDALDRFLREFPLALPEDAVARLLAFGRESFGAALDRPGVAAFWWPRFERIAEWYVAREAARRGEARTLASECRGRLTLDGPGGRFELTAIADRIDRLDSGELAIVDYKTGALPKGTDVVLGYAPQLALEAAIAEAGGFADVPAAPVARLSHWQLSGGNPPGSERDVDPDELRARIDEARVGLEALIARFDDLATPYLSVPRPDAAPRYSDYAHLERIKEWSVGGGDGE